MVGTCVTLTEANPTCKIIGHHNPDSETEPPTFMILSPKNETTYSYNFNLSFTVNVGISETAYKTMIIEVYYEADWLSTPIHLLDAYTNEYMLIAGDYPANYTGNVNLSEIPNGKHTITVFAREYGLYALENNSAWFHSFAIDASAIIQINKLQNSINIMGIFTAETEPPPLISVLSLENKTYTTSEIPLTFTVNRVVSLIKYSLDGEENVTIIGNTTLTRLPNGQHNITVYATAETGNTETSETVYFTIAEPESFPTLGIAAAGASATLISVGLMVYFKKRQSTKQRLDNCLDGTQ
jgi:hypothetical protein